jgi:hypothetical protein
MCVSGMGIGSSLMNPFGFSPFGMGGGFMPFGGYGMFGFRPMVRCIRTYLQAPML